MNSLPASLPWRIVRWLLWPVGLLHLLVLMLRHWGYDHGLRRVHTLPCPVVSIGNVQVGGSGKTPLTIWLAQRLTDAGRNVCVLTRGYGRLDRAVWVGDDAAARRDGRAAADIGDEPLLMLRRVPGLVVAVGGDRYAAARAALDQYPVDVFLLDDGFQHRRLARQFDLCLVDAARWPVHPLLIPFSALRDLKRRLRAADRLVIAKGRDAYEKAALAERLADRYGRPVLCGELAFRGVRRLGGTEMGDPAVLATEPVGLLCGIATPEAFRHDLERAGLRIAATHIVPDHQPFGAADLAALAAAPRWVTTAKDEVRLLDVLSAGDAGPEIWVWDVEFRFADAGQAADLLAAVRDVEKKFPPR